MLYLHPRLDSAVDYANYDVRVGFVHSKGWGATHVAQGTVHDFGI